MMYRSIPLFALFSCLSFSIVGFALDQEELEQEIGKLRGERSVLLQRTVPPKPGARAASQLSEDERTALTIQISEINDRLEELQSHLDAYKASVDEAARLTRALAQPDHDTTSDYALAAAAGPRGNFVARLRGEITSAETRDDESFAARLQAEFNQQAQEALETDAQMALSLAQAEEEAQGEDHQALLRTLTELRDTTQDQEERTHYQHQIDAFLANNPGLVPQASSAVAELGLDELPPPPPADTVKGIPDAAAIVSSEQQDTAIGLEEEAWLRAEEEARAAAEAAEAEARWKAEEEDRRRAEEETARLRAQEEARAAAETAAAEVAAAEARRKAEEEDRRRVEEAAARLRAEEEARAAAAKLKAETQSEMQALQNFATTVLMQDNAHGTDGAMPEFQNRLLALFQKHFDASELPPAAEARAKVYGYADQTPGAPLHFGPTYKSLLDARYPGLGAYVPLEQLAVWGVEKGHLAPPALIGTLETNNDSPSAMYNGFFVAASSALRDALAKKGVIN